MGSQIIQTMPTVSIRACVRVCACVRACFENTDNISVTLLVNFTYGNKPSR